MCSFWSKDETKRLIAEVQQLPQLWYSLSPDYKDRLKKDSALESLAVKFTTTASEISRKLHNLRTQLNNELRKIKKNKTGQGLHENYKSRWEFFDAVKFMVTKEPNETQACLEFKTGSPEIAGPTESESPVFSKRNPNKRQREDEMFQSAFDLLNKSDDDAEIFGKFVGSSLRNLRSEVRKRLMKRKIQAIILEMEELDELDSTKFNM